MITGLFTRMATASAAVCGKPITFILSVLSVILWLISGPIFGYSDTWQLVVNTATTVVTFLVVFLIQNTQNRDMAAIQLKLDELVQATAGARNEIVGSEARTEEQIRALHRDKFRNDDLD
jgi:low affinity Fe/Cu permease